MILSFKYKIYPNSSQIKMLEKHLDLNRSLYNAALEQRITSYKTRKISISYNKQSEQLKELKTEIPEFKSIHSQVPQAILRRLNEAFQKFFKEPKAGFPRFKSKNRFRSFLYPQFGFKLTSSDSRWGKLFLSKIGHIKVLIHRPIQGQVKTCSVIKESCGDWFVSFSCDKVPKEPFAKTGKTVGVDVGIKHFAVTSDEEFIKNPKYFNELRNKLAKEQRRLSKLSYKDSRRPKQVYRAAKVYKRIKNKREDFQHKLSLDLLRRYDKIFVEDLDIQSMSKSATSHRKLNRAIGDCAWKAFVKKLEYKAEKAGKQVIKVNPRNTSKRCSGCGNIVSKSLKERMHRCDACGIEIDRDLNASFNILKDGTIEYTFPDFSSLEKDDETGESVSDHIKSDMVGSPRL